MPQHSEEVEEIVGKSPSWLLRSGLMVILVFILLLLCGAWLFHYPDMIRARIEIFSENPPAHIVARTSGRLDRLFVQDNDSVTKGQPLAVIENTACLEDVLKVRDELILNGKFFSSFDTLYYMPVSSGMNLGDIQPDYSSFQRLSTNYISFVRLGYYPQKIAALKKKVRMQQVYCERLRDQQKTLQREVQIAADQFVRDSLLFRKQVLALTDYKSSETAMLSVKFDLQEVQTDLAEGARDLIEMEQSETGAAKEFLEQTQKRQAGLVESYNNLRSRIRYWKRNFVLEAPTGGKVTFTEFWSRNQQIKEGDVVFSVVPSLANRIIGRVALPVLGAGKVRPGQRVNIRLDNFPYMEYGMITGTVRSVSLVPSGDNYIVEISLPQRLITNYHIPVKFSQEMKGDAEIITNDLRLIQRFFNPIKSVVREHIPGKEEDRQ